MQKTRTCRGLSAVEEIKRGMLEAMDQFRSEAEKRFSEICMLNEVFDFLNPHALLRSENIEEILNKFKNIYADDVNFSKLTNEIARFNRLVQSSGTAVQSDATALDVLQPAVIDEISFMLINTLFIFVS